jgi:uncharacterized protein YggL (DUF469 family)
MNNKKKLYNNNVFIYSKKSRRIRKKKHLGEYTQFGFYIYGKVSGYDKGNDEMFEPFLDYLDSFGLQYGGGCGDIIDMYITDYERYNFISKDIVKDIEDWLLNNLCYFVDSSPITNSWKTDYSKLLDCWEKEHADKVQQ